MQGEAKGKRDSERTVAAIRSGDRVALARAITLIESAKAEDQARASGLLERLLPFSGGAVRVGISGPPGAGKSTLIDQLGLNLIAEGHKVAVLAVEAAGYDVVLVETVGVGQSETAVANMVDVFVVVAIPGAGDELQGIKRGLLELADVIAVNKADGDNVERANRAAMEYRTGLHILAAGQKNWDPQVLTLSARDNRGLDELWAEI